MRKIKLIMDCYTHVISKIIFRKINTNFPKMTGSKFHPLKNKLRQ